MNTQELKIATLEQNLKSIEMAWLESCKERDQEICNSGILRSRLKLLAKTLEQLDEEYGDYVGGKADKLAVAIEEGTKDLFK